MKTKTARLALTLLFSVLTTIGAWADPTIYLEPEGAAKVEVKNGIQIYITPCLGFTLNTVMWSENDPHGANPVSSYPCGNSYMGYYTAPNSGGYVVITLNENNLNWWAVSKSEGSADFDVLTISGTGAMADFANYFDSPWYQYQSTIKTINICEGVTSVGNKAFLALSALNSVSLPSTVTSIGKQSFYACPNLTSIELPANLTNIGDGSFFHCTKLTSIDIPASVTTIEKLAFKGCTSLASVTVHATTPPTLQAHVFDDNAATRKIFVPTASISTYKSATNWSNYATDIVPIDWEGAYAGTESDPYMIYSTDHLLKLAYRVNGTHGETREEEGYSGKYFKLGADIAFSHPDNEGDDYAENYETIGYDDLGENYFYFAGKFDGDNHTISGIRIRKTGTSAADNNQGLFGCIDNLAQIRNVHLTDARIKGHTNVGGIVGLKYAYMTDCIVTNSAITATSNYGTICGSNWGVLSHNYYHGCTVNGSAVTSGAGCNGADITENDGAVPMYVAYIDANGNPQRCIDYTELTGGGATTLAAGWYVVNSNISYDAALTLGGDVNIILADGKTMDIGTSNARISNDNCIWGGINSLTIYGQSAQTGTLNAYNNSSGDISIFAVYMKNYTQYGGKVTIDAKKGEALYFDIGDFTLARGTLNVRAANGNSAIYFDNGFTANVSGGTLNATATNNCPFAIVGKLSMTGGTVNTNGEYGIQALAAITISGGTLNASGDDYAIWGDLSMTGGDVTINGTIYGNATLGWTNATDFIKASSYTGTVTIADGKSLTDGTTTYTSGTLTNEQKNEIAGKTLTPPTYDVTANQNPAKAGEYWSTFCHPTASYQVGSGTTAYIATLNGNSLTLTAVTDGIIPANTAVVLKATSSNFNMTRTTTASTFDFSDNDLLGGSTVAAGKQAYTLAAKNSVMGFYRFVGTKLNPNKAHLEIAPGAARDFYSFDEESTEIKTTDFTDYTDKTGAVYDLQGRRVAKPTKGMYIVNGKIVVIK